MKKEFGSITAGGHTFRVTWDIYAFHLLQCIGRDPTPLETIHTAIICAAENDGRAEPITLPKLGMLFESMVEQLAALTEVRRIGQVNGHLPKDEPGKGEATESHLQSVAPIKSQPSISESAMASSGV